MASVHQSRKGSAVGTSSSNLKCPVWLDKVFFNKVRHKASLRSWKRYRKIIKNISKIGKKMTVLVEGKSEENGCFGRSQTEAPEVDGLIYVKGNKIKTGDFVEVKITEALDYDLIGQRRRL